MAQKIRIQSSPSVNKADVAIKEDLSQIHIPSPSVYRITEMFDFPSEADFIAVMYKAEKEGERDMIRIWADDTSGITADLTITPQMGFGCYNQPAPIIGWSKDMETDAAFAYEITISQETLNLPTRIFIPTECNKVDLFYFVGSNPVNLSYFIDTNGVYHTFSLEDTPMENFCNTPFSSPITINGVAVVKNTIKEIAFGDDYAEITSIGNSFLYGCSSLTSINFPGFTNITSIGYNFLNNCSSLSSVDLSVFTNVISIGDGFLNYCSSLSSIDLSAFTNITSIGTYFLFDCPSLTSIDFSGFTNVTSIGIFFLNRSKATSIDLSPLMNVTSIGDCFLYSCPSLTSVNFPVFTNITSIGSDFLSHCSSLTSIDLSGFTNVTSIGNGFLGNCTTVSSILLGRVVWSNKSVGAAALQNVSNDYRRVLYASNNEIAQAFKSKVYNASNWTVSIN